GGLVAGEIGVRGVGAEAVVGVVGAHLVAAGRQHQPLARERLGQRPAPLRRGPGHRSLGERLVEVAPALAHELRPRGGYGGVVRLRLGSVLCGAGLVGAHPSTIRAGSGTAPLLDGYSSPMPSRRSESVAFTVVVALVAAGSALPIAAVLALSGEPTTLVVASVLACVPVLPLVAAFLW